MSKFDKAEKEFQDYLSGLMNSNAITQDQFDSIIHKHNDSLCELEKMIINDMSEIWW